VVEMIAADPNVPEWTFEPEAVAQIAVSPQNLAEIQRSLDRATSTALGTAYDAFVGLPIKVAGKTGTAESGQDEPHAWFAGYAPAQSPEIAIAVVLEHGGAGGEAAAPLFREVVEAYSALESLGNP
jgi:penicillin-binding protein 2